MNNEKIYTAQLNASKYYEENTINQLINTLEESLTAFRAKEIDSIRYNATTNTIDINLNRFQHPLDDIEIREGINKWIHVLPISEEDKQVLCENNPYIFNITKIDYPHTDKGHIIAIHLF